MIVVVVVVAVDLVVVVAVVYYILLIYIIVGGVGPAPVQLPSIVASKNLKCRLNPMSRRNREVVLERSVASMYFRSSRSKAAFLATLKTQVSVRSDGFRPAPMCQLSLPLCK